VRILAVDDDAVARMAMKGMVTALGHECVVARDGHQAWAQLQLESFDVIITDRVMPDLNGLELTRRIRAGSAITKYVYVILASALNEEEQARDGMLAGADDYLGKPLRLAQLELKLIAAERVTLLHHQLGHLNDDLRQTILRDAENNDRLTKANQLQADMMAMLGHDARQPLSGVIGYLEAVLEEWNTTPDALKQDLIGRAGSAARRVESLIEDVLTMGQLDSGAIAARPQPVQVSGILHEAIESAAGRTPVDVEGEESLRAQVDPFHLRQIMTNLIGNAVKYGTTPIQVSAVPDGERVSISVCDSGEGVPAEFVPQLFDRFTRAETGIATLKPGTGFGLYIVRCLAEANGGHISYRPGEPGARFTVTLPRPRVTSD
jgi:signal transduction histidine kinase